jgi:uncharacterized membrane protein (DUF485 family)
MPNRSVDDLDAEIKRHMRMTWLLVTLLLPIAIGFSSWVLVRRMISGEPYWVNVVAVGILLFSWTMNYSIARGTFDTFKMAMKAAWHACSLFRCAITDHKWRYHTEEAIAKDEETQEVHPIQVKARTCRRCDASQYKDPEMPGKDQGDSKRPGDGYRSQGGS